MLHNIIISICLVSLANANPTKLINGPIVGGQNASITDFPWQVSLVNYKGHFCGGSIIGRYTILTAAHCILNGDNPDYEQFIKVRIGTSYRQRGGYLRSIKRVVVHDSFHDPTFYNNDIALVILRYPLIFTKYVQPIQLPNIGGNLEEYTNVTVTGWGSQELPDSTELPEQLQVVTVPLLSWDRCSQIYEELPPQYAFTENMLCAGFLGEGGRDSCYGDSGGPLAHISNGSNTLYGIVSWGGACGNPDYPGIYTRITEYLDWIKENQ